MSAGYERFFGLTARPFSLTSDPQYFFKSRSHGRAFETVTFALRANQRFLLVTGDLGVGKTMLCRTLVEQLRRRVPVAFLASPLIDSDGLERLLVEDFSLPSLAALQAIKNGAVIIVDQADTMPTGLLQALLSLSHRQVEFRFVFVGQSASGDPLRLGVPEIDDLAGASVRLLPLSRGECAAYIEHRLQVAGADRSIHFSEKTYESVFALSGGVPRLVNLLCERALQEAASIGSRVIEPGAIDAAASALQLLRARQRRFRWFGKRVS